MPTSPGSPPVVGSPSTLGAPFQLKARSGPSYNGKHPLTSIGTGTTPPSRAPTPLQQKVLHLPADTDHDEESQQGNGLYAGHIEEDAGGCTLEQSEIASILLKRSDDSQGDRARAKLETMKKQKGATRSWISTRKSLSLKDRRKAQNTRQVSSHDASTEDLFPEGGEVALGIKSLPEFSVMAVKGVAQKAKSAVGRAADRTNIGSFRSRSPNTGGEWDDGYLESGEGVEAERHTHTKTRLRSLRHPRRRHSGSIDGQIRAANASTTPATKASVAGSPEVVSAQMAVPSVLLTPLAEELKVVKEDQRGEEHRQETSSTGQSSSHTTDGSRAMAITTASVPTLHVQEPSDAALQPIHPRDAPASSSSSTGLSVRPVATRKALSLGTDGNLDPSADMSCASRSNSFLGGQLFDEPEGEDDTSPDLQLPASSRQNVGADSTSQDSDKDNDTLDSSVDRECDLDDSSSDENIMAQLSLQHGKAVSKKERRMEQKRGLISREVSGPSNRGARAASLSLGHKVTKGLTYASSESRNRRAMEKYSPAPARAAKETLSRSTTPTPGGLDNLSTSFLDSTTSFLNSQSHALEEPITSLGAGSTQSGTVTGGAGGLGGYASQRVSLENNGDRNTKSPSPHLDLNVEIPARSETPLSQTMDRFASGHASGHRRPSGVSSLISPVQDGFDRFSNGFSRRSGTLRSFSLTGAKDGIMSPLVAPRPWHIRQRKKWMQNNANEDFATPSEHTAAADPERELDDVLGKLIMEEDPDQLREKYEWDVLYENQRGLLFFGLPKFTARILMQWDPAPWTDRHFQNSPYNIVNAQLPDPRWDWIYPEWMIDMSGDVDESGWQYSGSFGRIPFAKFSHSVTSPFLRLAKSKRTSSEGEAGGLEMNGLTARAQRKNEKRLLKEQRKEDDGVEALKRSIRTRKNKWTSRPDGGTFVRRRRWIRLRKRRPITTGQSIADDKERPGGLQESGPILSSMKHAKAQGNRGQEITSSIPSTSSGSESEFSSLDEEDENSDESNHPSDEYTTSPYDRPSAFLPRRTAGRLRNGPHPMKPVKGSSAARRERRHQREFTGTLRDLKHLLPAILDPKGALQHGVDRELKGHELALGSIDARNPYISWKFVKKRLNEDDMSWKASSLRQRERHFQTRKCAEMPSGSRKPTKRDRAQIPALFYPQGNTTQPLTLPRTASAEPSNFDQQRSFQTSLPILHATSMQDLPYQNMFAAIDAYELTKDALVDINWVRVKRVLRACKVDRQRLELWRLWLGFEGPLLISRAALFADGQTPICVAAKTGDLSIAEEIFGDGRRSSIASLSRQSSGLPRRRRMSQPHSSQLDQGVNILPDPDDVWDLLERRLDSVLRLFEFNSSRVQLLKTLLRNHDSAHEQHRRRPETWTVRDKSGKHLKSSVPQALVPWNRGRTPDGQDLPHDADHQGEDAPALEKIAPPYGNDWVAGLASRLQFFSDVQDIATSLQDVPSANGDPPFSRVHTNPAGLGLAIPGGQSGGPQFRSPFAASATQKESQGPSSSITPPPPSSTMTTNSRGQPILQPLKTSRSILIGGPDQQQTSTNGRGGTVGSATNAAQDIAREASPLSRSPAHDHHNDLGYHGPHQSHYQLQSPRSSTIGNGTSVKDPQTYSSQQQQLPQPQAQGQRPSARLSPAPSFQEASARSRTPPWSLSSLRSPGDATSPSNLYTPRSKHPLSTMRNASPEQSDADRTPDWQGTPQAVPLPPSSSSPSSSSSHIPSRGVSKPFTSTPSTLKITSKDTAPLLLPPPPASPLKREKLPEPPHLDPLLQSNPSVAFQKEQLRQLLMSGEEDEDDDDDDQDGEQDHV